MKSEKTHEVRFKTDRNGRQRAYYYSREMYRWFPMGLEQAKLEVATGKATVAEGKQFPTSSEKGQ